MEKPDVLQFEYENMEYDYGIMKAKSEIEAIKAFGEDRTIIIRPTYMNGPGDKTDRFIYWPIRLSKGGEILVPGKKDDPVQYIDVRDVAEFMIRAAEGKKVGKYNVVGPKEKETMREFAQKAKEAFDVESTYVYIDDYKFLEENGVSYLIPWIPPTDGNYGSARINNAAALQAGLTFRPLVDTIRETYDWWMSDALGAEKREKYESDPKSLLNTEEDVIEKWKAL
jgi:2'-hydroxyisoflavone reductase